MSLEVAVGLDARSSEDDLAVVVERDAGCCSGLDAVLVGELEVLIDQAGPPPLDPR